MRSKKIFLGRVEQAKSGIIEHAWQWEVVDTQIYQVYLKVCNNVIYSWNYDKENKRHHLSWRLRHTPTPTNAFSK